MTESPAPVRQPLWQGFQPVIALWFDASWLSSDEREQRLLQAWQPGARALRFAQGDLLYFAAERWQDCTRCAGLPLRRIGQQLLSSPLQSTERDALDQADVGLVLGAQVVGLHWHDARELDLSRRISIDDYALHDTFDCRPAAASAPTPLAGKDLRQLLGTAIPPPSREAQDFLRTMQAPTRPGAGLLSQALRAVGGGLLGAAAQGLSRWRPGAQSRPASGSTVAPRQSAAKAQPWREWLAQLALTTRLSGLIGWKQGAYLRRLLKQFEQGDLSEALRHALPLDGQGPSLGQAFFTPGRRSELRLSAGVAGGRSSINLSDELHDHLRKLYRRSFEQLDRAGRIDEAVFVLAELLNARQEALDYLLKHERAAQAAELALGWDMSAALIVRLLLLADDPVRAVQVARRDHAFDAAIPLLQTSHPTLAALMRREWGMALVARGEWLAAVDAIWPLADARELACQWLLAAESGGVELSARALVQRACLLPDTLSQQSERITALADPAGDAVARTALAAALLTCTENNAALAALATATLPAIAADRLHLRNTLTNKELTRLLQRSNDALLKADLPPLQFPPPTAASSLWQRSAPLSLQAPVAGWHAVHDMAVIGTGRYLVALGEAGVAEVDSSGRLRRRYAVPATNLVIADSGQVALAIVRRDTLSRISRVDLVGQRIVDLGALPLQHYSRRFDGLRWSVVTQNRIQLIDASTTALNVLWQVADLPGEIVAANWYGPDESYLLRTRSGHECWNYHGSGRRLTAREPVTLQPDQPVLLRAAVATQAQTRRHPDASLGLDYVLDGRAVNTRLALDLPPQYDLSFQRVGIGLLVGLHTAEGNRLQLLRGGDGVCVLDLHWPDTRALHLREQGEHVLFFDDRGRAIHLHTTSAAVDSLTLC